MDETREQTAAREALRRLDEARGLMKAADVAPQALRNLWQAVESTRAKAWNGLPVMSPDAWTGGACSCGGDALTVGSHYDGCRNIGVGVQWAVPVEGHQHMFVAGKCVGCMDPEPDEATS